MGFKIHQITFNICSPLAVRIVCKDKNKKKLLTDWAQISTNLRLVPIKRVLSV